MLARGCDGQMRGEFDSTADAGQVTGLTRFAKRPAWLAPLSR